MSVSFQLEGQHLLKMMKISVVVVLCFIVTIIFSFADVIDGNQQKPVVYTPVETKTITFDYKGKPVEVKVTLSESEKDFKFIQSCVSNCK